jgi:hypothetical protein
MVDWGLADPYYDWIDQFKAAAGQGLVSDGTEIAPAPYLEVLASNGSWIRIAQDIPLPSDYRSRTYVVDLTGIFPEDITDYRIRFNNFWNVTYDYIGLDTTPQQNVTIQKIDPRAQLYQDFTPGSAAATGNFTKYGDVTDLLLSEDDMFVIGRQGDAVSLQFSTTNLRDPEPGMVRDYFFNDALWFKDENGNWGFGFGFTVDPLPFRDMSGFPYPNDEAYPNDTLHQNYLNHWNTRIIETPSTDQNSLLGGYHIAMTLPALILMATLITSFSFPVFYLKNQKKQRVSRNVVIA